MSEEEIMRQFNEAMREEELKKEAPENVAPYRATRNLNTQIGNPNMEFNNTMDVNIENNLGSFSERVSPQDSDIKAFSIDPMNSNIENNIMDNNIESNNVIESNINNQKVENIDNKFNEAPIEVSNNNDNIILDNNVPNNFVNNTFKEVPVELNNNIENIEETTNINNNLVELNENNDTSEEYNATTNLNVAIGNPEFNMDNAMDLNIENSNMNIDVNEGNEEYVPEEENLYYPGNTSNRVFISDTARRKKKKTIKINGETKVMLIIVIFLFVFISFLPKIYDFFRLIWFYFFG